MRNLVDFKAALEVAGNKSLWRGHSRTRCLHVHSKWLCETSSWAISSERKSHTFPHILSHASISHGIELDFGQPQSRVPFSAHKQHSPASWAMASLKSAIGTCCVLFAWCIPCKSKGIAPGGSLITATCSHVLTALQVSPLEWCNFSTTTRKRSNSPVFLWWFASGRI